MIRVTKGARQRHFILWLGVSSGRRESESLVMPIREDTFHPSHLYMSISGFINLVSRESYYNPRTILGQPGIHRAFAHYRRRLS